MGDLVTAAGIGAAAQLAGSLFGVSASRRAEDRAFQRSLQLQAQQNAWNTNMWRATNEYNSPSNQVKMLQDAGLNPAVFSGQDFQPASELQASDAQVSQNGEIGNLTAGVGAAVGEGANRMIQALQSDFQIEKLRNDIEYQKLLNRDYGMLVRSHEMELERPSSPFEYDSYDSDSHDGNNYEMTVYNNSKGRNYYERKVLDERDDRIDTFNARHRQEMENDVYQASMPFLKKMPKAQYQSMMKDIYTASLNNSLLAQEVQLMRKYGISPHDSNAWTSLIKMALRNPDAFGNIVEGIRSAGYSLFDKLVDSFKGRPSHYNMSW